MLLGGNRFFAPAETSEGPFPLGPFPRNIWIHTNTPQDSLDQTCHEIWKRFQRLSEELQPPRLVSPQQHAVCSDLAGTLQRDSTSFQSNNYLLEEPGGLESIYRAVIGTREREMKLRALCDAQLSAKSVTTRLLWSAKSHKNSEGLEDGSVPGAGGTEGTKLPVPVLVKHPDTARGAGNGTMAKETQAATEFMQNSLFSSARSSTAASTAAESQAAGQKLPLPPSAKISSKMDSSAVTKSPGTTSTSDKNVKYNATPPGFSIPSVTMAPSQTVWQALTFPPFSIFTKYSSPSFPQFQGPYQQRARIPYLQALHPSFGCYLRQVAPYCPQQILPPPYTPILVQPGYPYQQVTPPALPRSIQDLSPMAGDGTKYLLPRGCSATPGGAVTTTFSYFSSRPV